MIDNEMAHVILQAVKRTINNPHPHLKETEHHNAISRVVRYMGSVQPDVAGCYNIGAPAAAQGLL